MRTKTLMNSKYSKSSSKNKRSAQDSWLKLYNTKRRFHVTPEPEGKPVSSAPSAARMARAQKKTRDPIFVIQKHAATRLHYDFRLESEGVLKSWAVPKGPSNDPRDKRLAVETEDHPMAYAKFHGTIPKGEYGGGTVEIWDHGTFVNASLKNGVPLPLPDALRKGHVTVIMKGRRVKGAYTLARMAYSDEKGGEKNNWLLIKKRDRYAKSSDRGGSMDPAHARHAHG